MPTLPSGTLATHPRLEILRPRRCHNRGVEEVLCSSAHCSSPWSKALISPPYAHSHMALHLPSSPRHLLCAQPVLPDADGETAGWPLPAANLGS